MTINVLIFILLILIISVDPVTASLGAIPAAQSLINLAKDLKAYFKHQYRPAFEGLSLALEGITKAHQILYDWLATFHTMYLENCSEGEYIKFQKKFKVFKVGDDYFKINDWNQLICMQFGIIKGPIANFFKRDLTKYLNAKKTFDAICKGGYKLQQFVYDSLAYLENIIDQIIQNFHEKMDHRTVHEEFVKNWEDDSQKLFEQIAELHALKDDYAKLITSKQ